MIGLSRERERERAKEGGDGATRPSLSSSLSLSAILSLFFDCRRRPPSPACCCTPHHPGSPRRAFFRQSTAESASQSRPVSWRGPRSRQRWSSRDPSLSGRASVGVDVVDFEKTKKRMDGWAGTGASSFSWPCLEARRGRERHARGARAAKSERRARAEKVNGARWRRRRFSLPLAFFYVFCSSRFFFLSLSLFFFVPFLSLSVSPSLSLSLSHSTPSSPPPSRAPSC